MTAEKRYKCPDCDKTFSRRSFIERHQRLQHLDIRPFPCDSCSSKFSRLDVLNRHKKVCPGLKVKQAEGTASLDVSTRNGHCALDWESIVSLINEGDFSTALTRVLSTCSDVSAALKLLKSLQDLVQSKSQPSPISNSNSESLMDLFQQFPSVITDLSPTDTTDSQCRSSKIDSSFSSDLFEQSPGKICPISPQTITLMEEPELDLDMTVASTSILRSPNAATYFQTLQQTFSVTNDARNEEDDEKQTDEEQVVVDIFARPRWASDKGHLGEEQGISSRFYFPTSIYETMYMIGGQTCYLPSRSLASKFAAKACTTFMHKLPVIHTASLTIATSHYSLACALLMTGTFYDKEFYKDEAVATRYFHEKLTQKRSQVLTLYATVERGLHGRICLFQTFIIYLLLTLALPESPTQMALSLAYHGCAVMMMREIQLIQLIKDMKEAEKEFIKSVDSESEITGVELTNKWKRWIRIETYKRNVFLIWLADIECHRRCNLSSILIPVYELEIDLPSPDEVWDASSEQEWLPSFLQRKNKAVSFLGILRILLQDDMVIKCPYAEDGMVGPKLLQFEQFPDLGDFAEMVLSRTLGYLQYLVEQVINEFTPVPGVLEKVGLEGNDRNDMLRRLIQAIERVKEWSVKSKRS